MNRLYLVLISIVLLFTISQASAVELPQAALEKILTHDFDGDGSFRVGKAIFTDGRDVIDGDGSLRASKAISDGQGVVVGDCDCSTPRELFYALYDPIVVVSEWKVLSTEINTPNEAFALVRFHVLAKTSGQGYSSNKEKQRRLMPLAVPHDENVAYHLHLKGEEWILVDPPLPRVGVDNLLQLTRERLSGVEKNIKRYSDSKYTVAFQASKSEYAWVRNQLDRLEKLRKPVAD